MPQYKLRIKHDQEPPEEWSRVLVTFAGFGGIKLIEEFTMECIIEAGPVTKKMIEEYMGDYLDIFPYTPGEYTDASVKDEYNSAYKWWKS